MSTLPGEASPPKSGCSRRVPPLLMKLMNAVELVSTGAFDTSTFHQLSEGNTRNAGAAPSTGVEGGHCANAGVAARSAADSVTSRVDSGQVPPQAGHPEHRRIVFSAHCRGREEPTRLMTSA